MRPYGQRCPPMEGKTGRAYARRQAKKEAKHEETTARSGNVTDTDRGS